MSVDSNAICRGIKTYDTALPQPWVNYIVSLGSSNPYSHVVWCYDDINGLTNFMGYPRAIDAEGDVILGRLAGRMV